MSIGSSVPESAELVSPADSVSSVGAQTAGAYITLRLSVTQRHNADPAAIFLKDFVDFIIC